MMRRLAAVVAIVMLVGMVALSVPYRTAAQQVSPGTLTQTLVPRPQIVGYGDEWIRGQPGNWLYNQEASGDTIMLGAIPSQGANQVAWYVWADDSSGIGKVAACSTATVLASFDGSTWFTPASPAMTVIDSLTTRYIGTGTAGGWARYYRINNGNTSAGITWFIPYNYVTISVIFNQGNPAGLAKQSINFIRDIHVRRMVIPWTP